MPLRYCCSLVALSISLLGSGLVGQTLALHPTTDSFSPTLATIDLDDPRFTPGSLVFDDSLAAEGWYWGEFDGVFEGYVQDAKIGKDLLPVEGAYIHARQDEESRLLTSVSAQDLNGDRLEVLDRGEWWKIRFSKPIPVYYRLPGSTPVPPPQETTPTPADDENFVEEEPVIAALPAQVEPAQPLLDDPAPDSASEIRSTAAADALIPRLPSALPSEGSEFLPGDNVRGALSTTLRGRLERTKARLFVFKPPHPYQLVNSAGRRIAYVDLRQAILSGNLARYLDQTVTVFGPWSEIEDSTEIVIHVRTIRANPAE